MSDLHVLALGEVLAVSGNETVLLVPVRQCRLRTHRHKVHRPCTCVDVDTNTIPSFHVLQLQLHAPPLRGDEITPRLDGAWDVRGLLCEVTVFAPLGHVDLRAPAVVDALRTAMRRGAACVPLSAEAHAKLLHGATGPAWCLVAPRSGPAHVGDAHIRHGLRVKIVLMDAAALDDGSSLSARKYGASLSWQALPLGWPADDVTGVEGGGHVAQENGQFWLASTIICARDEPAAMVEIRVAAMMLTAGKSYVGTSTSTPPGLSGGAATPPPGTQVLVHTTPITSTTRSAAWEEPHESRAIAHTLGPEADAPQAGGETRAASPGEGHAGARVSWDIGISADERDVQLAKGIISQLADGVSDLVVALSSETAMTFAVGAAAVDRASSTRASREDLLPRAIATLTPVLCTMAEHTFQHKREQSFAETMRYAFAALGALEPLLTCIRTLPADTSEGRQALEYAIQALCNISFNRSAQQLITRSTCNAIDVLAARMSRDASDPEVQLKVARCFSTLCYENPAAKLRILKCDAVSLCVRALHNHANTVFVVEKVLQLLQALSELPAAEDAFHEARTQQALTMVQRSPSCTPRNATAIARLRCSPALLVRRHAPHDATRSAAPAITSVAALSAPDSSPVRTMSSRRSDGQLWWRAK